MKLKKNLIIASILAISVFVSSTSYASDKDKSMIVFDKEALSKMANKVNDKTIFAEELPSVSEDGEKEKPGEENKPIEENSGENAENPESTEGSGQGTKPEKTEGEENSDKTEDQKEDPAESEEKKDPNKKEEDKNNKAPGTDDKDLATGKGPSNEETMSMQSSNLVEGKSDTSNHELMNRLNNIKSQEESQGQRFYISNKNPDTGTLERLTSKETLTTSFNDKGSNLRLNLANTADNNDTSNNSKYVLRPQTLILLIAILGAIFSAISIAIRGSKSSKKDS